MVYGFDGKIKFAFLLDFLKKFLCLQCLYFVVGC